MTDKILQSDVGYTVKGTVKEHCGICRHYQGRNECDLVEGKVIPPGWCRRFEADRWALSA
jgi:hypothetical protein